MYKTKEDRIKELEDVVYELKNLLDKQDERIRDVAWDLENLRNYVKEFCMTK